MAQIDIKARRATFMSGIVLHDVHAALKEAQEPLALPNIGSISDQTLGGLISTASHGSGVNFPVLSQHVQSMTIILAQPGSPLVKISPELDPELFKASLCGLGATGLLIDLEVEVEPAFRLKEIKTPQSVDHVMTHFESIRRSAEHVRLWWYPDGHGIVVGRANRTYQASLYPTRAMRATLTGNSAAAANLVTHGALTWLPCDPIFPPRRPFYPIFDALGRSMGMVAL